MDKILLLVAKDGYSFVNQANALSKGLDQLNVRNTIIRVTEKYPEREIRKFGPSVVIGIGSWHSYPELVERPRHLGFKTLPWLVSDDKVENFIKDLND
jgi:hypothetical protein